MDTTTVLLCSKCRTEKPATLEFFGPQPRNPGRHGLCSWCRACSRRPPKGRRTLAERLARRLAPVGECLEWRGSRTPQGYGMIGVGTARYRLAHRVAWELHNGRPIADGLCVLHSCDNPPCCNPAHLRLGTNAENVADKMAKGRQSRGEATSRARATEDGVRLARCLCILGASHATIAAAVGVRRGTVGAIVKRRSWRHVVSPGLKG